MNIIIKNRDEKFVFFKNIRKKIRNKRDNLIRYY